MAKFYITTPIYYVNDVPHIGHAYTTIAADVLARWHRLKGDDVFFLTGTDEHGQKVQKAADAKGMDPRKFVDTMVPSFKKAWELLNISHNRFIRTTDDDHVHTVQRIISLCHKSGDIYKGEYEGRYCIPCETYWTEKELVENACPACKREVKPVKEESYFFRLSKYQQKLLKFYDQHPNFISPSFRRQEIINRVTQGLRDLSITRTSFSWGIPFPLDQKHVTYVWYDALTNYISGVGGAQSSYWPADLHLIGKEITWFHTVIWPAMLMSAGIELPHQVFSHGWLKVNGEKMSKSKGNFIAPSELIRKYGVDGTRYGLLRDIPFGADGDFNEPQLVARIHAELADSLGNLLQRTLTMVHKYEHGKIPLPGAFQKDDRKLIDEADQLYLLVDAFLEKLEFHKALEVIWSFIGNCNKYVNDQKPWTITETTRLHTVLYTLVESLRIIAHTIAAFMPNAADRMLEQLGQKLGEFPLAFSAKTHGSVLEPSILFAKEEIVDDPFSKVDLRVARIVDIKDHPNADKLYVLTVDCGEERTLCAGLKPQIDREDLIGKNIVIVYNLKPANLRGVTSQGMLLAADHDGRVRVLQPKGLPGDVVEAKGVPRMPADVITYEQFSKLDLASRATKAYYKNHELITSSGPVFCELDGKIR